MGVRRRRFPWLESLGFTRRIQSIAAWRIKGLSLSLIALCCSLCLASYLTGHHKSSSLYTGSLRSQSRRLLSTNETAVSHGPKWEQCDFEKANYPGAWIFSHTLGVIIIFIALAIICDDFFVPSLEIISEKLSLSEDVAGATFMAAGSSAPELFTSVAGVIVQTDVGVGTIVGSAVFNLLIIIALTGALAGQVLDLDWRPLVRDSFFYAMSIGCFIGFAWDGFFQHYEACILLMLYATYIILMFFNPRLMEWLATWHCLCTKDTAVAPSEHESEKETTPDPALESGLGHSNPKLQDERRRSQGDAEPPSARYFHHKRGSIAGVLLHSGPQPHKAVSHPTDQEAICEEDSDVPNGGMNGGVATVYGDIQPPTDKEKVSQNGVEEKDQEEEEEEEEEETVQICPCLPCCPAVRTMPPSADQARSEGGCMNWMKLCLRWILFIPAFPFVCLFSWTIPDCSKEKNKKYFILSFIMSVVWIAALSFGMVTLVGRTGCIIGIDSYVMGLVVIAIGTSIPDALSSILVARDGYGDMAVSNAIGSNVFDINLGLGLPFIIRIAIDKGIPIALLDGEQWSDYNNGLMTILPHAKFGFILLLILFIALTLFFIFRFRLGKLMGISFVTIYVMFLIYAFIQELYCVRKLGKYC